MAIVHTLSNPHRCSAGNRGEVLVDVVGVAHELLVEIAVVETGRVVAQRPKQWSRRSL